jgi:uncharacterized coiled-coil protein SlyX
MAELRQLTRRVQDLEQLIQSSPLKEGMMDSVAPITMAEKMSVQIADLEQKLSAYQKFLEDALAKLGLLEQKVVSLESKACQCGSEYSAESVAPMTTVVMTENLVYQEEPLESAEPVEPLESLEPVVEEDAGNEDSDDEA